MNRKPYRLPKKYDTTFDEYFRRYWIHGKPNRTRQPCECPDLGEYSEKARQKPVKRSKTRK